MPSEHLDIVNDFFKWLPPKFFASSVTSELYNDTVGSPLMEQYPVDSGHCSRFCRHLLDILENDDEVAIADREQVIEDLYNKIGELYSSGRDCDAYRTYFLSAEEPDLSVSMRETKTMISDGTTGYIFPFHN